MRSNRDVTSADQHTSRKLGELEILLHIAFHRGTNKYFFHKNSPDLSFHSGVYPVIAENPSAGRKRQEYSSSQLAVPAAVQEAVLQEGFLALG